MEHADGNQGHRGASQWTAMLCAAMAATAAIAGTVLDGQFRHRDTVAIIEDARANAVAELTAEARTAWPGELKFQPIVRYRRDRPLEVDLLIKNLGRGSAAHVVVHVMTTDRFVGGLRTTWPYHLATPTVAASGNEFLIDDGDLTPGITSHVMFYVDCPGACSEADAQSLVGDYEFEVGCANCPMETSEQLPAQYEGFPPTPTSTATATPTPSVIEYVVQSGDTLSSIGREFGVTASDIQAANPSLGDPHQLEVGVTLIIPIEVARESVPNGPPR